MAPDLIAGRYRVVRPVGRGGMGTVWLCRDEVLGREVAVKQIGLFPGESVPDQRRALREARSSAALNHRNVVSVFDVVDPGQSEDGHAWLVMEYVPSRTLREVTQQDGPLDPSRVARIGAQVAEGLVAAHDAGIVHRDVKPGNILVTDEDIAKITDFGIARALEGDELTRTGLVTGTPSYFSPELARGEDPGVEADVYALGATLYGAVEGRPPYPEQRNPIALLQTIAAEEPPPPTRAGPLTTPLSRMMDRDRRSRWTMADAAGALRRVAERGGAEPEDTAVMAAPAAPWPTERRSPERRPAAAASATTGRGDLGAKEQDHARRRGLPWAALAVLLLVVGLGIGAFALTGDEEPGAGREDTPAAPAATQEPEATPSETAPSEEPSEEPSASPDDDPAGDRGEVMESRVSEYFSLVPGDTGTAWDRLAPAMQAQGREAYDDWWASIDSVDLHSARALEGQPRVQVDLTYRFADGRATRETQVLTLEDSDRGHLIADDEVLSSRTVS